MTQPAKVLEKADVRRVLAHVLQQRYPARNTAMVQLSFKAGLRACEIAGLEWPMILKPNGQLAEHITVASRIAKMRSGRQLPLHPDLAKALSALGVEQGRPRDGPIIRSERGTHMLPRSIVNWFRATYAELGLLGCSSHSGRRTFITGAARRLSRIGASLKDVQELAGHRSLTTTERYIQGDRDAQRKLVALI